MFRRLKQWLETLAANRARPTLPESRFVVEVTETEIVNHRPEGKIERVAFAALRGVVIETNDSGPWGTDLWWILAGDGPDSGCVFPGGATGESDALKALQRLPGFDNERLIDAMASTDNARFVCWRAEVETKKEEKEFPR